MSIELNSDLGVFINWLTCVLYSHSLISVAGICFVKLLLLIRPAVVIVQSDKINTMLDEHRFVFDDTPALKQFIASQITLLQYCEQTSTSNHGKFDEDCDSGDDYAESGAGDESPIEEIAEDGSLVVLVWREIASGKFIAEKVRSQVWPFYYD